MGVILIGYNAAGEMVNEFSLSDSHPTWLSKGPGDSSLGEAIRDLTPPTLNTDIVFDLKRLNGVQAATEIPTQVRMHMIIINADGSRFDDTIPFSFTAGIRANSNISFTVDSNNGTSSTTQVTQGAA